MTRLFHGVLSLSAVVLIGSLLLWPPGGTGNATPLASPATLLIDEQDLEPRGGEDDSPTMLDDAPLGAGNPSLEPVSIDEVKEFNLGFYTDVGVYRDEQGRYVIDLLEQEYAYLSLIVTDNEGRAVVGASPEFEIDGASSLLRPEQVGARNETDASGSLDFAVIGGKMGMDEVSVTIGDAEGTLAINVISLAATGFPEPPVVEGGLSWSELMAAQISYNESGVSIEFPEAVRQRANSEVTLSGFMMPLDPDMKQQHFLLTSNPPSCFFHIPGGPAGAVEVFADEGIDATWDPVIIQGRLETLDTDEYGIIYRLQGARVLKP